MKYTIFVHQDGNISGATDGIAITHGKDDKPHEIAVETSDNLDELMKRAKVTRKGKKLDLELPNKAKHTFTLK